MSLTDTSADTNKAGSDEEMMKKIFHIWSCSTIMSL